MWYVKSNEPEFKNSEAGPGVVCESEMSQGIERESRVWYHHLKRYRKPLRRACAAWARWLSIFALF